MFTNHNSCYSFTLTFFKTDSDKQLSTCSGPSICSSGGDGNSGGDSGPPGDGPGPSHRPPPSVNKKHLNRLLEREYCKESLRQLMDFFLVSVSVCVYIHV